MTDYRVYHDKEKGLLWRGQKKNQGPVPEIFWLDNDSIPLTKELQWLMFNMNQPGMSKKRWRTFLGKKTAVSNSGGYGDKDDPRADFINGIDLDCPLPRMGKCYTFGGAKLRGVERNGFLVVETIDILKGVPTWDELNGKYWLYSVALIVGKGGVLTNFPYRGGLPVLVPLLSVGEVRVKLDYNVKDKPIPLIKRG